MLKSYRATKKLTQEEMSQKLFMSVHRYNKIENRRVFPKLKELSAISSLTKISMEEILS